VIERLTIQARRDSLAAQLDQARAQYDALEAALKQLDRQLCAMAGGLQELDALLVVGKGADEHDEISAHGEQAGQRDNADQQRANGHDDLLHAAPL